MNIFMWSDGGGGWRKTTREVKEYEDDLIFMKTKNYRKRKQSFILLKTKIVLSCSLPVVQIFNKQKRLNDNNTHWLGVGNVHQIIKLTTTDTGKWITLKKERKVNELKTTLRSSLQLHIRRGDASSERSTNHWAQSGEEYDDDYVDIVVVYVHDDFDDKMTQMWQWSPSGGVSARPIYHTASPGREDHLCRPSDCHHCRIPSRRGCDDQLFSSKRQDRFVLFQVKGKSAFNFFNAEDLPWTTMAMRHSKLSDMQSALGLVHIYNWHRSGLICYFQCKSCLSVFASSSGEGSTVYRLLTQTGQYICLQVQLGKTVILQISLGLSLFCYEEGKQSM